MKIAAAALALSLSLACGGGQESPPQTPTDSASNTAPPADDKTPAPAAGGDAATVDLGAFTVAAPAGWQKSPPKSKMRVAQFAIGDAELIVYFFGAGGAGGIEANLQRWYGQFEQPDGSDSKAAATTDKRTVSGFAVTTVDVAGTYVAAVRPGAPEKHNKPDHRMLAAIVETPAGPYFFKLLGPSATVAGAVDGWSAMLDSIQPSEGGNAPEGAPHQNPNTSP